MRTLSIFPLLMACSSNPYPLGFQFTADIEFSQTTTSFRIVNGGEPEESVGVVGTGETQSIAASSAGSRLVTAFGQQQILSTVVGETHLSHPLVPNEDDFDKIPASVVQERRRTASYSIVDELFFDPTLDTPQYALTSYTDDAVFTDAGYYGVAADEYVVRFDLGTLWQDFDEDVDLSEVELLTRNEPEDGDVWASENGNVLYIYGGETALNFAGQAEKVDKVEMFEATYFLPEGADVFTQCLYTGKIQEDETDSETNEDSSIDTLLLDNGCKGSFTHTKVGTQLWYKNVLVSEESTRQIIFITDYGFEWYEEREPNNWTRVTSVTQDEPNAVPFVEYTLTERIETQKTSKWIEP